MKDPYYQRRLERSKAARKLRKKIRPLSEEIEIASRMLITTISCLILITSVSFLYISGKQSAKGYHLEQLQLEYEKLSSDSRELQGLVINVQSLENLDESNVIENMTDPENEDFSYVGDPGDLASR